jgi:hypothetical protein
MNYKDNGGVDPITLKQGYKKLEGDPPNSGESVFDPRHVAEDKAVEAMIAAGEWPDEKEDEGSRASSSATCRSPTTGRSAAPRKTAARWPGRKSCPTP